ncbi:hypothetical protein KDRO_C08360 [Kluyveromyces lactis]|nr:hypothetical protein KDRO_C08360 [Kluyveromyces lactis]
MAEKTTSTDISYLLATSTIIHICLEGNLWESFTRPFSTYRPVSHQHNRILKNQATYNYPACPDKVAVLLPCVFWTKIREKPASNQILYRYTTIIGITMYLPARPTLWYYFHCSYITKNVVFSVFVLYDPLHHGRPFCHLSQFSSPICYYPL